MQVAVRMMAIAVIVAGCSSGTEPSVPTSLEIVAVATQTATAGVVVPQTPQFVVKDQNGRAMGGIAVTVSVTAGGGSLANAPTQTVAGATPVGQWTLGPTVGTNQLTISVSGLTSATVTADGAAGPASKIVVLGSPNLSGRVATAIAPGPTARVTDQFDNPVSGVTVTVTASGGATAPGSVVTDADGHAAIPSWTLGTVKGNYTLTLAITNASVTFTATALSGPPASIALISGDRQSVLAGTELASPIVFEVRDRFANGVENEVVAFAVIAGGGSLGAGIATTDSNGRVTLPSWRVGKSADPQTVQANVATFTADVTAIVQTEYAIEVRFFGASMTDEQRALFTTAANRLRAIVVGDVVDVPVTNLNVAACSSALSGQTPLTETIDDVIIYASVQDIDGAGSILASAGPCYVRLLSGGALSFPLVGVMRFDAADLATMTANGTLQDVITHEMLHVLGIGSYWNSLSLISVADNTYVGTQARQGCLDVGGASVCATSVPAENVGGAGTRNVHWRESTFDIELMTGFSESGPPMPLSRITIGGLVDLGYQTNRHASDDYQMPGAIRAGANRLGAASAATALRDEVLLPIGGVHRTGRVEILRPFK